MKIELQRALSDEDLLQYPCDCLVVGIAAEEGGASQTLLTSIDQASDGLLARLRSERELPRKAGQTLLLHAVAGVAARRLLLVGLQDVGTDDAIRFQKAARAAAAAIMGSRAVSIAWMVGNTSDRLMLSVLALQEADYRCDHYRKVEENPLERTACLFTATDDVSTQRRVAEAVAIAHGVALARDLGNAPANVCTPTYLGDAAKALAQHSACEVEVLGREEIGKLGMGAFLAVARGSAEPPQLIVVNYRGGQDGSAPIALVGKGVTFDSGGISIKPAEAMDEMKYDMGGAASVLGALHACVELKLPINVVGVIAACENMPGGNALKPGDVIRSLSGKTIEVLNTDAEGRLILCDALTYVQQRFSPALTIDLATLTGACVVALGNVHSGLYANDDTLATQLMAAGTKVGDRAWRMPLDDDYQEQLKSSIADVANLGGRTGGSITAACFLSRFVEGKWAHMDIAGTAWKGGANKGGTGRPVSLLAQFLVDAAAPV
ncbi:leucyl aminopeptidase [Rhodanobacter sp. PCA2]|uniref:leucyl aminopeptidase n=1 Tax=Rhodanobacter sp. PCA2 TaxID=2006117 RepID=UPI0015E76785|nr:leucyl aminopeptidase [Rhodanobacter sp. PCA2]MBA2078405.1 leucyl aminopeptidase [Rhodanobacter sp. PCA2]